MKKIVQLFVASKHILLCLLISTFIQANSIYAQSIPAASGPSCAKCGAKNGVHVTTCPDYRAPAATTKPPVIAPVPTLNSNDLMNSLLNYQQQQEAKEAAEAADAAAKKAIRNANNRRIADSIASINHNTTKLKGLPETKQKIGKAFVAKCEGNSLSVFQKDEWRDVNCSDLSNYLLTTNGGKIRTGKDSKVNLLLDGGSELKVAANSEVSISEDDFSLEVFFGKVRGYFVRLSRKETWEIRYRGGTCSIRGTQFIVEVDKNGDSQIILKEGEVEIETTGSHEKIILTPGKRVRITADGKIDTIEKLDISTIDKLFEE